ncbi:MAG: hypothetical protein KatS3mg078_0697 [Deltaproteobacteria bacterium]|jgi:hypothetical protein|nr:MAG: hypothetical protein KatS3mg078_0697 [Deltaproteobacteria bacterium]
MKRFLAITTLVFAFGFSSLSLASNEHNVFGVSVPVVKNEVRDSLKRGNIEKDFMGFYTSSKITTEDVFKKEAVVKEDNYISIFGVRISPKTRL